MRRFKNEKYDEEFIKSRVQAGGSSVGIWELFHRTELVFVKFIVVECTLTRWKMYIDTMENLSDAFVEIIMEHAPIHQYSQLETFLDYMTTNWIDDDVKFPISHWNHFHNENARTNNSNEAYNLRLDKRSEKHPNIWKFTKVLLIRKN